MPGELFEDYVLVKDEVEGSQIYNKGYFGIPQSGGGLKLELIEALYLLEASKLEVLKKKKAFNLAELIKYANSLYPAFEIKYIVYRDLRQRGYVVKSAAEPLDFRVYPRGGTPNKTPSKYWVAAISERAIFDLNTLLQHLDRAIESKKELLLGVVDEESDLTYYRVRRIKPKGVMRSLEPQIQATAMFLEDRVLVFDEASAKMLHDSGFYGKMIGKNLQLSLIEATYLLEKSILRIKNAKTGRKIEVENFKRTAKKIQPDFELRLQVYKDLKEKGLIVKTGFKYGAHFRSYENDPRISSNKIHARYLVHSVPKNFKSMWPEISRAVRLAHGVKKELLFGKCSDKEINYIRLERVRP